MMEKYRDHLPANVRDTLEKLKKMANREQLELLKVLDFSLGAMVAAEQPDGFLVESMVGTKRREPMVRITAGTMKVEIDIKAAREVGNNILSAAEAAIQDYALYQVLANHVDFPDAKKRADAEAMAAQLISRTRDAREKYDAESSR